MIRFAFACLFLGTLIGATGCARPGPPAPAAAQPSLYGTRIPFGRSELYYAPGVDAAEARAAAAILVKEDCVGAERRSTVQLRLAGRRYEARFIVRPGAEASGAGDRDWRRWGELLSAGCFRSSPVDVHLCDETLATLRVVPFEPIRPDLPVRVTVRPSIGGGSLVARYHNDSEKHLTVVVALKNATVNESKSVTLHIPPRGVTEHGWAEGWAYRSGETVDVAHADYETARLVVP